jgi:hypothetical protein
LVVLALAYSDVFWCLHMYILIMLYVYCCKNFCHNIAKLRIFFVQIFMFVEGGAPTVLFAPVVPWANAGPVCC